ncbi:hypothetical protein [Vibrio algivorus]|uniref:Uncharacterized protein n=1 Tax=Vibrio algivorus TaxID=1667024 RepID=A0A557PCW2_9VIBR|nr:hypothetical protein [Vibrio algivorus]TVO38499.1 hypothetical protein FOF44_03955 [Vibrio algivorus]GLT15191.1 hypothetical protein GCM10007931_21660 [Vibrio algivorus]
MSTDIRFIFKGFGQFLLLALLVTLPIATLSYDLIYLKHGITETSLTEYFQELILLLSSLSFAYIAYKEPSTRHFCTLAAGFFGCMFIRELDGLFDLVFHGFWIVPALFLAAACMIFASRNIKQTIHTFSHFTQSRHFFSLCLGMSLLLVFSRLFGMGHFWQGILGPEYDRTIRRVTEEGLEVLGYTIIFYSSLGYLQSFLTWRKYRLNDESYSEFIGKRNQFFTDRLAKKS